MTALFARDVEVSVKDRHVGTDVGEMVSRDGGPFSKRELVYRVSCSCGEIFSTMDGIPARQRYLWHLEEMRIRGFLLAATDEIADAPLRITEV